MKQRDGNGQSILEAFLELGRLMLMALLAALLAACSDPDSDDRPPAYGPAPQSGNVRRLLGAPPPHTPQRLLAVFGPLTDSLNQALARRNVSVMLEASRDYAAFEEKPALAAARRPGRDFLTRFQPRVRPGGQT